MNAKFPRRLVLRGFGGLALALPLLEFTQSRAYGADAAPPKRFVTFFEHGGTLTNHTSGVWGYDGFTDGKSEAQEMDGWRPTSSPGQPLVLGPIHKPLADAGLTGDVLVLRGVDNRAAMQQGDYGSGHIVSNYTILTAGRCKEGGEADADAMALSPSIDQYIASQWGAPPGGVASVNLLIDAHNYGSPYFRAAKQHASRVTSPQKAFDLLLTGVKTDTSGPDPAVVRAQKMRRSILDGTAKELDRYRLQLTAQDRQTVDAHFEHVRSIEQRLAAMDVPPPASCSLPTLGRYDENSIPSISPLMVDIGLAALRCGRVRVLNIEIGDFHMTWDTTPIPFEVGYNIGHDLHHMARDLGNQGTIHLSHPTWRGPWQQAMIRNRQFRAQQVARLLKGMKDTPEGNGTLLDNSLFLWTSEFSNGATHLGSDMPLMLAGKAGTSLQTGRYLNYNTQAATNDFTTKYASNTSTNNVYISALNLLGFSDTTFGDMRYAKVPGPLTGLL